MRSIIAGVVVIARGQNCLLNRRITGNGLRILTMQSPEATPTYASCGSGRVREKRPRQPIYLVGGLVGGTNLVGDGVLVSVGGAVGGAEVAVGGGG